MLYLELDEEYLKFSIIFGIIVVVNLLDSNFYLLSKFSSSIHHCLHFHSFKEGIEKVLDSVAHES